MNDPGLLWIIGTIVVGFLMLLAIAILIDHYESRRERRANDINRPWWNNQCKSGKKD